MRREHDSQIVQIAMEAGLRIAPDQWSSLLYGDTNHKSHMQSIIDKVRVSSVHVDWTCCHSHRWVYEGLVGFGGAWKHCVCVLVRLLIM